MPPIISVIQWTPERSLATTIKAVKKESEAVRIKRSFADLILNLKRMIDEGITVLVKRVVDDGYEASSEPLIKTGR